MTDVAHVHTSIKKIILDIANSKGTGTSDIDLRSGGPASSLTLQSKGGGGIWLGDFDYDFTWDLLPGGAGGDQSQSGIDSAALGKISSTVDSFQPITHPCSISPFPIQLLVRSLLQDILLPNNQSP